MLILIFVSLALGESPSYLCTGCSKPYNLGSFATVGKCPSQYALTSSTCNPSSSLLLFSMSFSSITSMIGSSIGPFSVQSGDFSLPGNPFPTVSRGFYFPASSFLQNSQLVPSPDLTIELWVRILTDGYFFGIKGTSAYLGLKGKDTVALDYRYCASNFICSLVNSVDSKSLTPSTPDKWKNVRIKLEVTGMTTITSQLNLNYQVSALQSIDGQNAVFNEIYTWTFGMSSSGFSGFIYAATASNSATSQSNELPLIDPPLCDPQYFYDEGLCSPCTGCTNNGWCVRSSSCSICLTNFCAQCSGYHYDDCSLFNKYCSSGCISCTDWNTCLKCGYNYITRDEGWGKFCEEDLRIILISTTVADFVVSGSNENNDYTDNTSTDDPKPVAGRGYYFTSTQFLTTRSNLLLPSEFMIYMWVFPITIGRILTKGSTGITDTSVSIDTKNLFTGSTSVLSFSSDLEKNIWNYHVVRVHLTAYLNIDIYGKTTNLLTFKDLGRNDSGNSKLVIGDPVEGFSGYVAYAGIASIALNPTYYIYGYLEKPNLPYGSQFNPCSIANAINCNVICSPCDICLDFAKNECFACPFGFYHTQTPCPGASSPSSVVKINTLEFPMRGSCLLGGKGLGCLSCFSDSHFYLYKNLCIINCATGFSQVNGKCAEVDKIVFVKSFKNLFVSTTLDNMAFGSETVTSYPYLDANDPIPAYNRGFYFKSNSFISVTGLFFGPKMSISIWVFVVGNGDFYYKKKSASVDNFKLNRNVDWNTYFNMITAFSSGYFKEPSMTSYEWNYVTIKITYEPVDLTTYVELYYNENWQGGVEYLYDFFEEDQSYPLILGSDKGYGFTGFMYMVIIYSSDWTFSETINYPTCGQSPEVSYCIDTCLLNQRFDSALDTCVACDPSCVNGCVKPTDCVICLKTLCATCSTVDSNTCSSCKANSELLSGNCKCLVGYEFNPVKNSCDACASNTLYFTNYQLCVIAAKCPGISPAISSICTMADTQLVYITFQSYTDTFSDLGSNIKITTGSDSSFYPSYSLTDPRMIPNRGFYFSTSSFVSIDTEDKIVLGPEFTIGFWIKPQGEGTIFERSDGSSLISVKVLFCTLPNFYDVFVDIRDSNNGILTSEVQFEIDTWKLFEILVGRTDQSRTVTHSASVYTTITHLLNNFKDSIIPKSTKFGFFNGFAWDFVIYNFWHPLGLNQANGPIGLTGTLSNCLINQYDPICLPCDVSCTNGCTSSGTCSICTDQLCYKCASANVCSQCYGNATLTQGVCSCPNGFDAANLVCRPASVSCFSTCATCEGSKEFQCLTCRSLSLIAGTCIECPNKFRNVMTGTCSEVKDLIFYVKLSGFDGILFDTVENVPVVSGKNQSFYPDYDPEDPFATVDRGFFFDGVKSVARLPEYSTWTTPKLVMPTSWTLETWINPELSTGCIFSWTSNEEQLFSLCFNSTSVNSQVSTTSLKLESISWFFSLNQRRWSQVLFSFSYSEQAKVSLRINNIKISEQSTLGFIPNYLTKTAYFIGKSSSKYFKGFIYEVSIYSYEPASSPQSICGDILSGKCIPNCRFDQFWIGPGFDDCLNCSSPCSSGCKSEKSCSLCAQDLCSVCQNSTSSVCQQCVPGAELNSTFQCSCQPGKVFDLNSNQCQACQESQYFDNGSCFNCSQLCLQCNKTTCFTCIKNAVLDGKTCKCLDGYSSTEQCTRSWFAVKLKITEDNEIFLHFTQVLKTRFGEKSVEVKLANNHLKNFKIEIWSQKSYKLILSYTEKLQQSSVLQIKFTDLLYSVDGSQLSTAELEGQLVSDINPTAVKMKKESMQQSVTITISLTSASIGLAMANPNPSSLWSFISTVQMLCFVRLLSIDLPPRFEGYLEGLKKYNLFPNVFEYFVPHAEGQKPYTEAFLFGYDDHLILFNTIVAATPALFLYYSRKNKEKIQEPEVQANWGTLFYEFNNDRGMDRSNFYFFYFARRIFYISVLVLMRYWPVVQISLNIVHSAVMCFYIFGFTPFSEKILNKSNCISELCITFIFSCTLILLIDVPDYVKETLDVILVSFIHTIMGIQMFSSLLIFVKTVYTMIQMRRAKRNVVVPSTIPTFHANKFAKEV